MRTGFGSHACAAEELVAELGVRNAGYIASWIELLKGDKRAFFTVTIEPELGAGKAALAAGQLRRRSIFVA